MVNGYDNGVLWMGVCELTSRTCEYRSKWKSWISIIWAICVGGLGTKLSLKVQKLRHLA